MELPDRCCGLSFRLIFWLEMTAFARDLRPAGKQWHRIVLAFCLLAVLAGLPVISGCSAGSESDHAAKSEIREAKLAARSHEQLKEDSARRALDTILPPSKSLYLSVSNRDDYRNPFLVVHSKTIALTVLSSMEIPHASRTAHLARPVVPAHHRIEVPTEDLAAALASLPSYAWPYGRVVAVEEAPGSRSQKVQIRRNVEATFKILNDLGVVIDEWDSAAGSQRR